MLNYIKLPLYLSGEKATVNREDSISIGTAGSYGIYAFEVDKGKGWENLDIKGTFYSSKIEAPITTIETNEGLIPIPSEILKVETKNLNSQTPDTWVTFSGYQGLDLKLNSLRLMLKIQDTGPSSTEIEDITTPDLDAQLINEVKKYRDEAGGYAEEAKTYLDTVQQNAQLASDSAASATESENGARAAAGEALLSQTAAKESEQNAKESELEAKKYADLASQNLDNNGYVYFTIDSDGNLYMYRTQSVIDSIDFKIDENGNLIEVTYIG